MGIVITYLWEGHGTTVMPPEAWEKGWVQPVTNSRAWCQRVVEQRCGSRSALD